MRVVATYSIKGGVGKTTLAVNLAYEATRNGARVVLWDLDPQEGATYLLRVRPKLRGGARKLVDGKRDLDDHLRGSGIPGLDVVPADFSLRHLDLHLDDVDGTDPLGRLLEPLRPSYDLAMLDCPPSISLASEAVFAAADVLLVPVVPSDLASRTLAQLADFLATFPSAPAVVPVLSMVDRRRRLHRELMESLAAQWPDLLDAYIPASSVIERLGVERRPVAEYAPRSPGADAIRQVWSELAPRLWPQPAARAGS